jgi:peptidoglycan/LPS O-acetylase OafA/YrhL
MKRNPRGIAARGISRIPSLDGLRAISIGMVLVGHAASGIAMLRDRPLVLYTVFNGSRGVTVFFVISGFLITSLLLQEHQLRGKISLKDFYIRRAFRILPPFWLFLATVVALSKLGMFETTWANIAIAFAFLRDYMSGDWWTGHSWSLSVEEQFYLLWPAALVLIGRRKSLWIACSLILAAPVIRVLSHLFVTGRFGPIEFFMFHMRMDSLMFGCVSHNPQATKLRQSCQAHSELARPASGAVFLPVPVWLSELPFPGILPAALWIHARSSRDQLYALVFCSEA